MAKRVIYPQGVWGLFARSWELALHADNTNYRGLRTFFNWMVDEGELDRTPMDRTKPPILPEKPIPVVTDESLKNLFASCRGKDFTSLRDTAIIRVLFDNRRPSVRSRELDPR